MTVQSAKSYGKTNLPASPTPALDTEVLLQFITGLDKTHLLLNRDLELSAEQENQFLNAIEKRKTGLPISYITGHKEFFGYDFFVSPDVLIPKPDTELLVELALAAIEDKFISRNNDFFLSVCDMCAGSGCVGISILKEIPKIAELAQNNKKTAPSDFKDNIKMIFADISDKALQITKKNAENLLKDDFSLHFVQSNLFENIPQSFDLIVTNPPYVPHLETIELLKDGRNEPILALDGDVSENGDWTGSEDGLSLIRRLVPQCYEHLNPNGILIMETGEYNATETADIFKASGFREIRIEKDMNEMPRDVIGVR